MKVKTVKYIDSLEDIKLHKEQLRKKAKKREKKIKKQLQKLKSDITPQNIYNEVLTSFKMEQSILNMLPMLLKHRQQIVDSGVLKKFNNAPNKKYFIVAGGSIGIGLLAYWLLLNKNKDDNIKEMDNSNNKQMFI